MTDELPPTGPEIDVPPGGLRVIDGGEPKTEAFSPEEARQIAALRNGGLRLEAGLAYITNPQGVSLADLAADPRFRGQCVLRTLERWCSADRWPERREKWVSGLAEEFQRRVGSQLVQRRLDELTALDEIRGIGMDYIRDPTVRPKSWGEAVKAVNETSERMDQLTKEVQGDLTPTGQSADEKAPLAPGEADAAVAAILAARRSEGNAAPALPAGQESDDTPPQDGQVLGPQQPEAPDSPS